ncbi:MAG: PqiC family protein [bacterium]|nr:PqiC family protein [bacterium]
MHAARFFLLCLCPALLLGGCATRVPVRNYTLASVMCQPLEDVPASLPVLQVAPVVLPDYLQRGSIVTRLDANRVKIASNDQWAGDLADGISRVLANTLGDCLGATKVVRPGERARVATAMLDTSVNRCEPWPDGRVELVVNWVIHAANGTVLASQSNKTYRVRATDLSYDAYAQAISKAVTALGQDIAVAYCAASR